MKGHGFGPGSVAETETTLLFPDCHLNIYQNVLGNHMNDLGPNNGRPPVDGRTHRSLLVPGLTESPESDVFDSLVSIAGRVLYSRN